MANKFVRLETGFFRHPKTLRLRRLIGEHAFWIPPRLWAHCVDREKDDISDLSPQDLADLLEYPGDAGELVRALVEAKFVSSDAKTVCGWAEHYGMLIEFYKERAKRAAEARWGKFKEKEDKTRGDTKHHEASNKDASSIVEASNQGELFHVPTSPKRTNRRDPLFDALACAAGMNLAEITSSSAKPIAVALADIREATPEVTAAEIDRRTSNYRLRFPNARVTPNAVAKHWASLSEAPAPAGSPTIPEPQRVYANLSCN